MNEGIYVQVWLIIKGLIVVMEEMLKNQLKDKDIDLRNLIRKKVTWLLFIGI